MSSPVMCPCAAPDQPLALHLVEEISHRVVNEYMEAISILSLAGRRGHANAASALALAADRLRAKAEAHNALMVPSSDGPMDLGAYVGKLCATLSEASLRDRNIWLRVKTDEIWLEAERCWRIGLIVSELIRNAARHGLKGRSGSIVVALSGADRKVRCLVSDDGCAMPDPPEGRGRRLVRTLAAELGGEVDWWFTPSGSSVGLQCPLEMPPAPRLFSAQVL